MTAEEQQAKINQLVLDRMSDKEKKRINKIIKKETKAGEESNWGPEETALLSTGAANLGTMIASSLGNDPTSFDRVTKTPIKLDAQKKEVKASSDRAKKTLRKNVRNIATSSGEALAALSAGNAGIEARENQMLNQISDQETLMNTRDEQNVKQMNANIAIKEAEAKQMDEAVAQTTLQNAMTTLSENIQGYTKDKAMSKENLAANKRLLSMLKTGEYQVIPDGQGGYQVQYTGDLSTKDVGKDEKK